MRFIFFLTVLLPLLSSGKTVVAEQTVTSTEESHNASSCAAGDRPCLLAVLDSEITKIENDSWRDKTFRELAKLLAHEGQLEKAIALIDKITNPDTKAMTIRGIGMAAAKNNLDKETYSTLFTQLRAKADEIDHPPSYAIALTYIAMAQAFAQDDKGAMATALAMDNEALRNKALGETAEIQAERGDLQNAIASLDAIDSASFKDKACGIVSKIFADKGLYNEALQIADKTENPYQRAQALLQILTKQITPAEVSIE